MRLATFLAGLGAALGLATAVQAAPGVWSQIDVTGFDQDLIAENSPAASYTTTDTDGGCNYLYAASYPSAVAGLPSSRILSNGGRSFELSPYDQPNGLLVRAGNSRTLTLTTPGMFEDLGLLVISGGGDSNMVLTVNFRDGSSEMFNPPIVYDWYVVPFFDVFTGGFGRVHCDNSVGQPTVYPSFLVRDVVLSPENRLKDVVSLTVSNAAAARLVVFAVDGKAFVPPVPTASPFMFASLFLALMLAGGLVVWLRSRRAEA